MSGLRFTPSLESLDQRLNPSASPMPVLLVIADQQDFYMSETRVEAPRPGGANFAMADGSVRFLKDTAGVGFLRSLEAGKTVEPQADTSAVVFVGGWGSSMYQYS